MYVQKLYGALSDSDVIDITVISDVTWQRRGFSSLFGVVFIIEYNTGLVLHYVVKSKMCESCRRWESKDPASEAYKDRKETHTSICKKNFDGSAASMEANGTLDLFFEVYKV